jgi:protein-tyrosine-phosphatase
VSNKLKVLFVCSGNTCRSPMAVAVFRSVLREEFSQCADFFEAGSAGLHALPGLPASPLAVEALRELGIELGPHRSRQVDGELLRNADFVLTMTRAHRDELAARYPEIVPRLSSPGDYLSGMAEDGVPDPIGLGLDAYRESCGRIRELVRAFLVRVVGQHCPGPGAKGGGNAASSTGDSA